MSELYIHQNSRRNDKKNRHIQSSLDLLRTKFNQNYVSPHRAVNTLRLGYKTNQLMLYREIIAVRSQIHTKSINTAVVRRT